MADLWSRRLGGLYVPEWSFLAMTEAGCDRLLAVCNRSHADDLRRIFEHRANVDVVVATEGWALRLLERETDAGTVVLHDVARPFVSRQLVERVIAALVSADGAIAAVPVDETLKRTDDRRIVCTVDRSGLWRVQTPQAFRASALRRALRSAPLPARDPSEYAGALLGAGGAVTRVQGSRANIRISSMEHLLLAEAMARSSRRSTVDGGRV